MSYLTLYSYRFFYIICIFIFIAVMYSTPFLKYPYDIYQHLIIIDNIYESLQISKQKFIIGVWVNDIYILVPNVYQENIIPVGREIWHYIWAYVFSLFNISSIEMFLRAKLIHISQIYISLFSLYYFSKVVLRNLFNSINEIDLKWLSFWSVVIWISIFSTFSMYYHNVWVMWYSVNYQVTLPLFWYMLGLTLVLFLEKTSIVKKIFFSLQILILSRFILQAHSMEFLYYMMYFLVFFILYIDKVYILLKKYFYMLIPFIVVIGYSINQYQLEESKIIQYLSWNKLDELYLEIMHEGEWLLSGYNRANVAINELMIVICIVSILVLIYMSWNYLKYKSNSINIRLMIYISITSLFILIPLYQFSGGLFGVITRANVVNRVYYSSSLFLLLPIVIYYCIQNYKRRLFFIHIFLVSILLSTYIYSKYSYTFNQNYYKNIQSIKNSFIEKKIGFNLNKKQIKLIGNKIKEYESNSESPQKIIYYTRHDIAFVIKYLYKRKVYWEGRRSNPNYKMQYLLNKNKNNYQHILLEPIKNFPSFVPYI